MKVFIIIAITIMSILGCIGGRMLAEYNYEQKVIKQALIVEEEEKRIEEEEKRIEQEQSDRDKKVKEARELAEKALKESTEALLLQDGVVLHKKMKEGYIENTSKLYVNKQADGTTDITRMSESHIIEPVYSVTIMHGRESFNLNQWINMQCYPRLYRSEWACTKEYIITYEQYNIIQFGDKWIIEE